MNEYTIIITTPYVNSISEFLMTYPETASTNVESLTSLTKNTRNFLRSHKKYLRHSIDIALYNGHFCRLHKLTLALNLADCGPRIVRKRRVH